jgi:hypothetical protein
MPANPYGYGLCICLDDDQCEALGFKAPLPAGSRVVLRGLAIVVEATQSVEMDGDDAGPDVRMRLQITDLEVVPKGGSSSADLAASLYSETGA